MTYRPQSAEEAAAMVGEIAGSDKKALPVGSGTKMGWVRSNAEERVSLSSLGLDQVIEHNAGDFTAVLGAGLKLAEAQAIFAEAGQMLAWDPPLGADDAATIGGIVATADSGPLRHRYGGVRDTVIGATVVLSDGLIAKSGGRVIKNVAGYDLAKLYTGSFGRLGLIASVAVRLHPLTRQPVTLRISTHSAASLTEAALSMARRPLELDCLDFSWQQGAGVLLARASGATAKLRMEALAKEIAGRRGEGPHSLAGIRDLEAELIVVDAEIWEDQRRVQRSGQGLVLKVSALPTDIPQLIEVADSIDARLTGRAGLGISWLNLEPGPDLRERGMQAISRLAPRTCLPLDGADRVEIPLPELSPTLARLNETIQRRFDPVGLFRAEEGQHVG